jgi:hypothetical protein
MYIKSKLLDQTHDLIFKYAASGNLVDVVLARIVLVIIYICLKNTELLKL